MLHSVLRAIRRESIAWRAYPRRPSASATDATANDCIRDRIVAYVRAKQQPVSCGELRQRFVEKLGFRDQRVMAACLTEGILHYLNGILVHVDTISWDDESRLSSLVWLSDITAIKSAPERCLAGWTSSGNSMNQRSRLWPTALIGMSSLVAELLEKEKRIGVFGNRHNAFVFLIG